MAVRTHGVVHFEPSAIDCVDQSRATGSDKSSDTHPPRGQDRRHGDIALHAHRLVAIDSVRNLRRRWRVVAARDLFGRIVVETGWGRIGTHGRTLVRSFAEGAALAYVRAALRQRASAPRRIGVAYVPTVAA